MMPVVPESYQKILTILVWYECVVSTLGEITANRIAAERIFRLEFYNKLPNDSVLYEELWLELIKANRMAMRFVDPSEEMQTLHKMLWEI